MSRKVSVSSRRVSEGLSRRGTVSLDSQEVIDSSTQSRVSELTGTGRTGSDSVSLGEEGKSHKSLKKLDWLARMAGSNPKQISSIACRMMPFDVEYSG
jgi:hypothetical protein